DKENFTDTDFQKDYIKEIIISETSSDSESEIENDSEFIKKKRIREDPIVGIYISRGRANGRYIREGPLGGLYHLNDFLNRSYLSPEQ
ncbi:unnamed protein product, partial [Brachionus calyciflorus]